MLINISNEFKENNIDVAIGSIRAKVKIKKSDDELWKIINEKCIEIQNKYKLEDVLKIENIHSSRVAYKKLGKDPSRYKVSSESLVRRIVKGNELYKVNNVVDINNLISLISGYSIGCYDNDKIDNTILFKVGEEGSLYKGIGRGDINLSNMPLFEDKDGKFGSTTSDSYRAMIRDNTENIAMNIISFDGDKQLNTYIDYACELLKKFADADIIDINIFKN